MKCSICGEKRHDVELLQEVRCVLKKHGFKDEDCNPGGRELFFEDGRSLQISDMCLHCDYKRIKEFLGIS